MKKITVVIPIYNQEKLIIRALDSIPNEAEIIVVDDCSTDNTWNVLLNYKKKRDIILLHNDVNEGVGYTVNQGYNCATGEYVVLLGSDDYFYIDEFNKIIKYLDGTDLVYFNLEINDGTIWKLSQETKKDLCGSVKFMRRKFIGNTRCPKIRSAEDKYFYEELLKKNPTETFTNLTIKHYNFPRKNSLTDIYLKEKTR